VKDDESGESVEEVPLVGLGESELARLVHLGDGLGNWRK